MRVHIMQVGTSFTIKITWKKVQFVLVQGPPIPHFLSSGNDDGDNIFIRFVNIISISWLFPFFI